MNAKHAHEYAAVAKQGTIELLRRNSYLPQRLCAPSLTNSSTVRRRFR
jgi:hypothetical protein